MSQEKIHREATLQGGIKDNIATITLSNPNKYNALTQRAWESIPPLVNELVNGGARIIIISGEGDNFCAGADISEFDVVRKNAETALAYEKTNTEAFKAVRDCPVPTIAKIRGYCLGGGFGIAAACDLRLSETQALFSVPAARLGLAYPVEAMADIVHAIGVQNTKQLMFSARKYSAAEIHALGFLSEVTNELDIKVEQLAEEISDLAPFTHKATKAAISAIHTRDFTTATELGNTTFNSADYAEGRKAFREKRPAKFTGS